MMSPASAAGLQTALSPLPQRPAFLPFTAFFHLVAPPTGSALLAARPGWGPAGRVQGAGAGSDGTVARDFKRGAQDVGGGATGCRAAPWPRRRTSGPSITRRQRPRQRQPVMESVCGSDRSSGGQSLAASMLPAVVVEMVHHGRGRRARGQRSLMELLPTARPGAAQVPGVSSWRPGFRFAVRLGLAGARRSESTHSHTKKAPRQLRSWAYRLA